VIVVAVAAKKAKKRAERAVAVYVEEVSSGSKPIEAVGTAVAAFVGL
jgi:phage tail sheath protein FI